MVKITAINQKHFFRYKFTKTLLLPELRPGPRCVVELPQTPSRMGSWVV